MRLGNPEDIFYVCSIFLYTLVSSLIISQAIVFDPEYDRNCVYQLLSRIPVSWDLLEMIQYDGKLGVTMTVIDMSLQLSFLFITYYLVERETYLAWVNQVGPTLAQRFKELFTAFWSKISSAWCPNSSRVPHAQAPLSMSEDTRTRSSAKNVSTV